MDPVPFFVLLLSAMVLLQLAMVPSLSTRASRADARLAARLGAIERRLKLVMDHLGIVEPDPLGIDEVRRHLDAGNKIQAIKVYRDTNGGGLKEAKRAVEELARSRGG